MPVLDLEEPANRRRLLVVALGLILLLVLIFAWRSAAGGSASDQWSYTQLVKQAAAKQVRQLQIKGESGVATDVHGKQWNVGLPPDTTPLATQLSGQGVDVVYQPGGGVGAVTGPLAVILL